eukprot:2100260-Rhodomonas_salina.1
MLCPYAAARRCAVLPQAGVSPCPYVTAARHCAVLPRARVAYAPTPRVVLPWACPYAKGGTQTGTGGTAGRRSRRRGRRRRLIRSASSRGASKASRDLVPAPRDLVTWARDLVTCPGGWWRDRAQGERSHLQLRWLPQIKRRGTSLECALH